MRRVWTLAGTVAFALTARAAVARAATTGEPGDGKVTSLSIVPASGHAELLISVNGAVQVQDFTLASPPRLVLDVQGARLAVPARMYDKVPRGGITNVRVAQFRDDVVRVVVDLDSSYTYTVTRDGTDRIRVAIDGPGATFAAWHAEAQLVADAAVSGPRYRAADPAPVTTQTVPAAPRLTRAPQPRITVTYQDADIRDVISAFAAFSGRTIVVGSSVKGTVSAEVHDQPWDVALQAILKAQGLDAKEDRHGIITVDSYENIASQRMLEPLTTTIIPVNYTRAASLVPTVQNLLSRQCTPGATGSTSGSSSTSNGVPAGCTVRGNVSADTASNRLIVTDVPSRLSDIANYVQDLDIRTPQVAIKAKIITVDRSNLQDLGLSYDLGSNSAFFNSLTQRPDPSTFKPVDTNGDGVDDAVGGTPMTPNSPPVITLGGNALAAVSDVTKFIASPALQLIYSTSIGKYSLTAFLDALQQVQLSDVQAEPSIVTLDNREATLMSGEETPIRIIDASSSTGNANQAPKANVQFKKSGIILTVTPHVTNNGQILMTIHAENSKFALAPSADLGYIFTEQSADNQILVSDGETAVIGGLTMTTVNKTKNGIPLLVDLPIVGRLFGETKTQEDKQDLLILVTPHIVDPGERIGAPGGDR